MGDISKYTVGYDTELAATKAKAMETRINKISNSITKNRTTLEAAIDSFWSGQSCNNFKSNIQSSTETIIKNINTLATEVAKMIESSADQMADVDANAVTKNS